MFFLTLAEIIDAFKNKKLDKSTTINYLKSFLENCEDEQLRIESIEFLIRIDSKSDDIFKFFEKDRTCPKVHPEAMNSSSWLKSYP